MSVARAHTLTVRPRPLHCEHLETRMVLSSTDWTTLPSIAGLACLGAEPAWTVPQQAPISLDESSVPPMVAAQPTSPGWQGVATYPILVTALLVTLCGQVELFGGRRRKDSWTTPLL